MHEIGRITTRIKLGGGLNLLCIAGAAYVGVKALTEIVKFNNHMKYSETMDEVLETSKRVNDFLEGAGVYKKSEENAETKEEAAE